MSVNPSVKGIKYLGVILDKCINMYEHVTSECRVACYHHKNIQCLKAFLTQEALAIVTSHIHYCNSTLYGIFHYNINRLQQFQNSLLSDKYLKILSHYPPKTTLAAYPFQDFINNVLLYFKLLFYIELYIIGLKLP